MTGSLRVGIGGWTYEPWRGVFYPDKLSQKKELAYASSKLSSIEINGTYYSTFKPDSWMKWRDETPEGFVFAVKASRYCTNRKILSEMGESMERFLGQGLSALGDKLGPINWQFMGTKKFDPVDFEGFLKLLPKEQDGVRLRHALEVRNLTFDTPQFYDLASKYGAAIVYAVDEEAPEWAADRSADGGFHLCAADVEPRGRADGDDLRRAGRHRQTDPRLGEAGRCLRLFHRRSEGAQSGGGAGADRQIGLRPLRRAFGTLT
jgi:uncharacterized protein YecE (DUF72 family)